MRALIWLLLLEGVAAADENETVQQLENELVGQHLDRAERLLAPQLALDGLWFAADDCKRFAKPQTLADKDRGAFVECLGRLSASSVSKHHGKKTTGVILMRDGLAIGATVKDRQVSRLGFVETNATDAAIPTVFRAADQIADHIVVADDLRAVIDHRDDHHVVATLKTCLDARGKVTKTRVVDASGVNTFDVLARWTIDHHAFAAVQLAGAPTAVCEVIRFERNTRPHAAPPDATRPMTITLAGLEPSRKRGTPVAKLVPDAATKAAIAKAKLDRVRGTWKACFDGTGAYVAAQKLTSTGFAAFDAQIEAALKGWAFQAVPERNGVCTLVDVSWHP